MLDPKYAMINMNSVDKKVTRQFLDHLLTAAFKEREARRQSVKHKVSLDEAISSELSFSMRSELTVSDTSEGYPVPSKMIRISVLTRKRDVEGSLDNTAAVTDVETQDERDETSTQAIEQTTKIRSLQTKAWKTRTQKWPSLKAMKQNP